MRFSKSVRLRRQVQFLQRQFLQDGDLPFTDVLSSELVSRALTMEAQIREFYSAGVDKVIFRKLL